MSEIKNAAIISDVDLIISSDRKLLNDEMVEYPSDGYGIKSQHIIFWHKDKVIYKQKVSMIRRIEEGILISCEHNWNYFHWIVKALPKLIIIDSHNIVKGMPLLIPNGLNDNRYAALNKANISSRPVVKLNGRERFRFRKLIIPPALSRVLDRYKGKLIYDADIVLSQKWISKLRNTLICTIVTENTSQWQNIFATRRNGNCSTIK